MDFTVVTSNILFSNPKDGEHDWPHRKHFLSKLLLSESPDIVGTQEGRRPQLVELEELLAPLQLQDSHRDWIAERMYPCLYVNNTHSVIESGDRWLSTTPHVPGSSDFESQFPRLMTYARLSFERANQKNSVLAVNTHLDHVKAETRVQQARVLVHEIHELLKSEDTLILMGDFNESPDEEVRTIIQKSLGLNDPFSAFYKQEIATHHSFRPPLPGAKRIDWILASPELRCLRYKVLQNHKQGLYPSDHFPVSATFQLF